MLSSVMDAQFTTVGIAQGPHTVHGNMVVCTFALAFIAGQAGVAPQVGQKSAPGMHTIQFEDRKTEEQTLCMSSLSLSLSLSHTHTRSHSPSPSPLSLLSCTL